MRSYPNPHWKLSFLSYEIVCFHPKKSFQDRLLWIKKKFVWIVCFRSKDRLLWLKRSSAFVLKIVCFDQDRLLSTLPPYHMGQFDHLTIKKKKIYLLDLNYQRLAVLVNLWPWFSGIINSMGQLVYEDIVSRYTIEPKLTLRTLPISYESYHITDNLFWIWPIL